MSRRRFSYDDPRLLAELAAQLMDATLEEDFGERVVTVFAALVPGAAVSLDQIHPASGLYDLRHNLPMSEKLVSSAVGRLMEVYGQSPVHRYMDAGGPETLLDLRELASGREIEKTEFYQDVLRPLSIKHQVAVRLNRPGWTCTLTLNRDKVLTADLKAFLRRLTPLFVSAHRVACEVAELRRMPGPLREAATLAGLTPREHEVLMWMRQGKRNAEISLILGCAVRTVEKHVENILRKAGAETRTGAVGQLGGC